MNETREALIKQINRLTEEVREVPRSMLEEELGKMQKELETTPCSPGIRELFENGVVRTRLLLQWSNQAHEQLFSSAEYRAKATEAMPDIVDFILKRGRPLP